MHIIKINTGYFKDPNTETDNIDEAAEFDTFDEASDKANDIIASWEGDLSVQVVERQ